MTLAENMFIIVSCTQTNIGYRIPKWVSYGNLRYIINYVMCLYIYLHYIYIDTQTNS